MEKYKNDFLEAENYTAKRSFDSSMKDKIIATLQEFFPDGSPIDRAFVICEAVLLFQRYTTTLEMMDPNIHCYIIGCLSIVMRHRRQDLDRTDIWHQRQRINLARLREMEDDICNALDWTIIQLTALHFMSVFREQFSVSQRSFTIANKLILETQLNDKFINRKPSLLALSALIVSADTNPLESYLQYTCIEADELKKCVDDMEAVYRDWVIGEIKADPYEFDIDWLSGSRKPDLPDFSSIRGQSDPVFTFKDTRGRLIEIYHTSKMRTNLPIFDDVYIYTHVEEQDRKFYVIRHPIPPDTEDTEESNPVVEEEEGHPCSEEDTSCSYLWEAKEHPYSKEDNSDSDSGKVKGHHCSQDNLKRWMNWKPENITRCEDLRFEQGYSYIMFEYAGRHLSNIIDHNVCSNIGASNRIKNWMKQILNGINDYHSHLGAHGHIRPESILVKDDDILCIADFCLDKKSPKLRRSRYDTNITYKAPENLLNTINKKRGKPADIWAIGCIFGHFLTGSHLFEGNNSMERLSSIFSRLGTPSKENWPKIANMLEVSLKRYGTIHPPEAKVAFCPKGNVREINDREMELLSAMLRLNPKTRATATLALGLSYFKDFETKS